MCRDSRQPNRSWRKSPITQLFTHDYISFYGPATIYAVLGDKDETSRLLERAYQQKSTDMLYLAVDPSWTVYAPISVMRAMRQLRSRLNFPISRDTESPHVAIPAAGPRRDHWSHVGRSSILRF